MGLNHIYKVIWSKTKNAWVVVSEIAKRDGKSSVKSVVTSLAGKSVAAVMVAMVMCGGVASAATGTQYGTGATATYNDSVAVGENAQATNSGTTLVGANSQIKGQQSSVVGINNKDYSDYGISPYGNNILGSTNNVKGQNNIIVGNGSTISSGGNASSISSDATGNYNVAIGNNQSIGGDKNISILSDGYRLRGNQNISIGYGSHVGDSRNAEFALAIGAASAQGNNTVAIGRAALAENVHNSDTSIAIGTLSQATDSIAIGSNGTVGGIRAYLSARDSSVNIGYRNAIANNKSVILGTNNNYGFGGTTPVSTDGGVAIGHDNNISGAKNEVIIGSGNNTNGESQIAIGTNIQSNTHLGGVKGAVAIGYNSEFATLNKPSGTLNINGVNLDASNYAGNSSSLTYGNTFSIGKLNNERQLKNVAAGEISATSTDAINGSQLYEAVRAVTAGASPDVYMHVNDGTLTQGAGNATTNLGKANEKGGATGNYAIAIGPSSNVKASNSIGIGYNSVIDNSERSTLIGWGRIEPAALTLTKAGSDNIVLTTGFKPGTGPSYIRSSESSIVIGAETQVRNSDKSTAIGKYARVYDSDKSTAIGYGAAVNRGDGTFYIGNITVNTDYNTSWPTYAIDSGVFGNNSSISGYATAPIGSSIPTGVRIIGNNNWVRGASDVMILGNNIMVDNLDPAINPNTPNYSGAVILGSNSSVNKYIKPTDATINGDTFTSTNYAGQGTTSTPLKDGNIVSVGAAGAERQIKNVAAGEVTATSTDAINGSQLYYVADELAKSSFGYMHVNDGTTTQKAGTTATNYGAGGSKAGATGTKSIAGGVNAQAAGEKAIAVGADATASGGAAIAIGKSSAIDSYGTKGIVLGSDNNITNTAGGILLGNDSSIVGTVLGGPVGNSSQYSVLIGTQSHITDSYNAVSIGITSNISQSNSSVVIGNHTTATNSHQGIVIGESSTVKNAQFGIAIGTSSEVSGQSGIAIGLGANASGEKSISIGTGNEVKGNKSSAIGDPSYIDTTATGTHVQGNDNGTATNPIKASESTFMGNTNLAGTAGTTGIHVVGNNNSVDSSNVMVMGNGVNVGTGLDGAVVLGNASSADQYAAATDSTINGVTFEAAGYAGNTGLNKGSIVSVGATSAERQIKNVAAGAVTATSTDAVNGSQLYKTAETILKMPINMAGDSGDTVGLKLGKTVNIKGSVTSGADVTDGNIAVVGDKATSTLSLKMAKNLTGLTSGTFTDATGNQTVINGAGVTVTPTGTGATPISITTSGINAGNQEIKGVKKGTTDDAAVNKKQMDDALAGISSTLTINDGTTDGSVNIKTGKLKVVGESGTNALVTTTVSGDTISVGTSTKLQNAVTAAEKSADKDLSNLSTTGSDKVKTLAQDAVKVAGTGLATVSDATAAGVKTYTVNVDEGKLVIDDTTGKVGAAGSTQGTTAGKNGVATTQDVASVVNSAIDKTKQALADAEHKFDGDTGTTSVRKHGEVLSIKGGVTTTADLTTGNIGVVSDGAGTLNVRLAKALTGLTSATYTDATGNTQTVTGGSSTISDAAGNSTVVSKGGVTTTDGTNTTTVAPSGVTATDGTHTVTLGGSGINAGGTEIKNVGKATTDDAAVNKKQMDDALKGATDNTVSLGSESGSTTAKKLSTTGGITFNIKGETGANALITTSATGDDVTIAPTAKLTAAVTAAEKSADKDLSNLSAAGDTYIKNLAKTAASWNVETNGAGTTAVAGGDTVNFINGDNIAITNTGRSITIGTAKNVSFDKVTVGGVVIDKTDGINAGNKEIKGVATGTAADSAVNKAQMDAAITAAAGGSLSTEKVVAKTLTGDNNLATVAGQTGTAKGETYEVSVSENAVKAVAATAAQDAVKVAGTGLATVSDATAAGVKTYTVNVDEGKLVIDDTTGKLGAAGATQGTVQGKNGVATTQNVADVVNSAIDKTKQALTDAKHDFAGDDATVISRKHGEQLNIKGGASTTATDLTSGNIAVVGDTTSGTLNIKMAKALTGLTSATYTDAAGNTQTVTGGSSTISDAAGHSTVVSKGGVTTTDGTNTTTVAPSGVTATDGTHTVTLGGSGISAGGTEIKNVGKATTDDAAVNKKQMDDAVKAATDSVSTLGDNKVSLGSDSGTTTAKKLSTTGGIKFNIKGETGANALITTSATGDDVTIAPTAKLTAAVTAAENAANKDLSNLNAAGDTYIKNLAKSAASWNVETNGAGTTAVAGGDTVNFINGDNIAITNTGRSITIGTAKNVSFDKVTVGGTSGIVIDGTTKQIGGLAAATANDQAVNKGQMDTAIANAQTAATSTEKVVAKALTGDTNLATVAGQTGTAKGETYEVSVSENAVKAVAKTAAQDAVKVAGTGLATVSDATAAGVKTYTVNVDEGKLVIDDTTGKVGAAGSTQGTTAGKNGVATTQDVASVVNSAIDKTKQALDDAKHDFAGDDATVISRKHGEQLNIKGGASTTATDLTSGNIAVVGDTTSGTLNIKLAKVLTGLTSATYTDGAGNTQTVTGSSSTISDAAGNSTVVSKGGVTTTDGTNTTTVAPSGVTATDGTHTVTLGGSGISAGGTEIKNVGKATTDDAAVNKKQMDDAVKAATDSISSLGDNKVSLGSDSGTTTAKKLSTTGGIKFNIKGDTGANALITTSATGDDVTIAPTAKLTAAVTAAENSANKDLSNLSAAGDTYIKNLAKTAASWNVETNGAGTTAVAGGETVNFINGDNIAITNTGRSITIGTSRDVSFDKVTVGGIVLDKNTGINAGGKEIKGVANATSADAAVNKGQLDAAVLSAAGGALSIEKVEAGSVANGKLAAGDNNLASVSGLTGTAKNETYTVTVSENAVKAVAQTAAQDAVKVAGTGLATVSDATAAGVKTYTVNVDEGKLVIDDTTGKVGAAGSTQGTTAGKNGVATTQDVASVVNSAIDKTKQALDDAKHDFAGDDATVISRKHGEQLNIKGGASTTATDLTSGNIAVVGDTTSGTLNIKLAKVLTGLTSATYTDAAGNTQTVTGGSSTISDAAGHSTVVSKGGVTTTDGTNTTTVAPAGVTATDGTNTVKLTGSGIDAGNTQIKNVGKATTDDAAVNKKQMDDAVKAASDATTALGNNTITLGSDNGSTDAKKLNTSGGIQFNINGESGANALITTTASGNSISIASTTKLSNAVAAAENAANKDLSNLSANGESRIKDLAKSAASWNVQTNGGTTTAVSGGDNVNFVDGKNITITNTGREITVATKDDVTFNKVTVGGMTLDNNGMDAGNKEIKNVAAGTTANSAVNKQQLDNAISGVSNINYTTSSTTDRAGSTPVRSVALSTGFDFKGDGNIQVTQDAANNGVINYAMNPNLSGITSITGAGNGAPTMTFNSQNGNTPANVSINSNLDMGGHRITGVGPAEKPTDAVNKQQVDQALRGLTGMADNAARQYASKAGANAAALAALKPIQYDPLEPTQIMAGVGNYKSQTAVALGMAHYTNENTMFNIGVSLDSHDNMVNAGVTHKFGYSPEKKAIPDRYKGGPISSIYVMQDEMQALLAKDQEKDAVISKQASEIDTLRQQNEDMQRKIDMILAKLQ